MLHLIRLEHFKCFQQLELPLAPLTVLTGLNASGKSTTIQALALFHQTLTENPASPGLILNGKNVSLGTSDELVNRMTGRTEFAIGLDHAQISAMWRLRVEARNMTAPIASLDFRAGEYINEIAADDPPMTKDLIPVHSDNMRNVELFEPLLQTIRTLTYISADRIGPRETYPASSSIQQSGVGARGEYTPWYIDQYESLEIPSVISRNDAPPQLKRQVEAWLAFFFPGSALDVQPIERTNLFTMRLRTNEATPFHRPANVGYGISHVLPVITACLGAVAVAAQEARLAPLVIVENPELHLHPAGQSAMGRFLAQTATTGAQVIIETHSDHVLNGIRVAARRNEIRAEDVAINYFVSGNAGESSHVLQPRLYQDGGIEPWPRGFFDQQDFDLQELF